MAILCLPVLQAFHLSLPDDDGDAPVAAASTHAPAAPGTPALPTPLPLHDLDHCAVCLSFHAAHFGLALTLLAVAIALRFDVPAAFRALGYFPPSADDAYVALVAIPRGPPALA